MELEGQVLNSLITSHFSMINIDDYFILFRIKFII